VKSSSQRELAEKDMQGQNGDETAMPEDWHKVITEGGAGNSR